MQLCLVTFGFIVLDFISGTLKAFATKTFESSVMRKGLFNKAGSVIVLVIGFLVDYAQTLVDIGLSIPLSSSVCAYIIIMECGSLIENLGAIDSNLIPPQIKQFFSKLNDED